MELLEQEDRLRRERIVTRRLVKPRLDVKYPQVTGLRHGLVQRMVNSSILDAQYDLIRMQGYVQDRTKTITGTFETKLHQQQLLSLVYDNYGYADQAAHGITYRSSQTFDLTDGTLYRLGDLFKPGSDYLARLSAIISAEFKARDIPMIAEFKGIGPDQSFYLTPAAIGIYFQLYEYTPYAYGFPVFEIPFSQVQNIINPTGPIGRLQ